MTLNEFMDTITLLVRSAYQQDNPLGNAIVWLITFLFIVSLLGIVSTLSRIGRERRWLKKARKAFAERDEEEAVPTTRDELLEKLMLEEAPQSSLVVRQTVELLRVLPLRGFDASLIRNLAGNHFELGGGFARFSAGTLTVIGLIGTVLGLSVAVGQLPSLLQGIDSEYGLMAFSRQMLATLSGMGTAFACTLAGLSSAVVLSLLNYVVRERQARVLEDLDTFIYLELAPLLVPQHEDHATSAFVDKLDNVGQGLRTTFEKVLEAAGSMKAGAESIGRTTEDLAAIAAPMRELATNTLRVNERLEDILKSMVELNELPQVSDSLRKTLNDGVSSGFEKSSEAFMKSIETHMKNAAKRDREMKQDYANLLIGVQDAVEKMLGDMTVPAVRLQSKEDSLQQSVDSMTTELKLLTNRFASEGKARG